MPISGKILSTTTFDATDDEHLPKKLQSVALKVYVLPATIRLDGIVITRNLLLS